MNSTLRDYIARTPLIDTHEHLIEESRRLGPPKKGNHQYGCSDWAYLFVHYAADDLVSAGMTPAESERFFSPDVEPKDKWRIFAPYYARAKNTGYLRAVELTIKTLYGVENLNESTVDEVTQKMRAMVKPGFYRTILRDVANIDHCHVNSLEHQPFCQTEQPQLLKQDLSLIPMCVNINLGIANEAGIEPKSLNDWHRVIDWWFGTYGPGAIAVKSQAAYQRRLNFEQVNADDATPLFARLVAGEKLRDAELGALQNHLFNYCVARAAENDLPVKLHTGYYVANNRMPLDRVRQNAADLCPVLMAHPKAKFVLMHIGYPYQDEMIALAKHYPNAYVDLCWAWIINPLACVRFLKEALAAAPASKFFCFGGDYFTVEPVVGHSMIARQGLTQALSELVAEGWASESVALEMAERLMRGNAREIYRS